jgi:EAL domain-containing protein (putative c-di-GMP-specific phosphodiesterase class I)
VEVTEGAIVTDPGRALQVLARLRALGVGVSVDDFGTGYSSFAYLERLPVDELKIDRSFVDQVATNTKRAAIVRNAIALGHDLGMSVVAEGVEDQAAWDVLGSWGCDLVQGYFVSRPLAAAELTRWLDHSRLYSQPRAA